MAAVDLEELLLFFLVVHDGILLDNFDFEDGVASVHQLIQLHPEVLHIFGRYTHVGLTDVNVEVRGEVVNMGANRITLSVDSKDADDGLAHVLFLVFLAEGICRFISIIVDINLHKLNFIGPWIHIGHRWPANSILSRQISSL